MPQSFELISEYTPKGDQPHAIAALVEGLNKRAKFQTLLGATGTGKSLPGHSTVWLYRFRDGKYEPFESSIGKVVDLMMEEVVHISHDLEGTEVAFSTFCPEKLYVLSFNPLTGCSEMRPITSYQRHYSPPFLYRLSTRCGRQVEVTGDHNFYVLRKGEFVLKKTEDIKPTDYIPLPRSLELKVEKSDLLSINLLCYLDREDIFVEARPYVQAMVSSFGISVVRKTFSAVGVKNSCQKINHILRRYERVSGLSYAKLTNYQSLGASIGSRNSGRLFPIDFSISNEFLELCGLYIAEGCDTPSFFILSVREAELQSYVENLLNKLKLPIGRRQDGDFQVNDKLFTVLLRNLCGKGAFHKKLPNFWAELSLAQLGRLLSMYFTGDGWVDKNDVKCTTASPHLASQLLYALSRFGICGRVKKRFQRASSSSHKGNWYYQIAISGKSQLKLFDEWIGFYLSRKTKKLQTFLSRGSIENTNVDVIPYAGIFLKSLRARYNLYQREIASYAKLSRSAVGFIEAGQRSMSFSALKRFLAHWPYGECEEILALRRLIASRWTPVSFIEKYLSKEKWVYDFSVEGNETFLAGFGGLFVHNTYTIAQVIQEVQRPTLVIAHNKTLAAQLCSEFREFFPKNAVHYFVSYYDYYQPEAYNPSTDTYIEKDASINEEIDKFRHAATANLLTRRDVIIVASVSCIYGLGSPKEYLDLSVSIRAGEQVSRDRLLRQLVDLQYTRVTTDFKHGMFHVLGDVVEVLPPGQDTAYRLEFFGDDLERITEIDSFTDEVYHEMEEVRFFPAKHSVTTKERIERSVEGIRRDLEERHAELKKMGKDLEAHRIKTRTEYDLELLLETGYCPGIENYTRYLNHLRPGEPTACLIDYFPDDFLLVIDESHMTVPQIGAMYNGNFNRKQTLVEYGFRLPSSHDNRPLKFEEFEARMNQVIFVSATPSKYEHAKTPKGCIVEQIIRPTGLVDPDIMVRPTQGQVLDLLKEIEGRVKCKERVLITTLTKQGAENLTEFLREKGVAVRYLHSDIDTLERIEILRDFRLGKFDVLVGINLLREGLDLPEVSLIGILDADKEGFLRSTTSLIQTIGRAARNVNGFVIMYADKITNSMKAALEETNRRRAIQTAYNKKHGIKPATIVKAVKDLAMHREEEAKKQVKHYDVKKVPKDELMRLIRTMEEEMDLAAQNLEFEKAAELRDEVERLKEEAGV